MFTRSPGGPALHAFGLDADRAVAHCAVIPQPARRGSHELRCGKLEALWVEESHRGRGAGEEPVYRRLLDRLYEFVDERGFDVLHGYATPRIGHVIRFTPLEGVGRKTFVSLVPGAGSGMTQFALGGAQGAWLGLGSSFARLAAGRLGQATLRSPAADDADLVDVPPPRPDAWTAVIGDAWEWYRTSPLVRVLEVPGNRGSRALVQIPAAPHEPVRLIGWRPVWPGVVPAVLMLAAARRLAQRAHAPALRFQPWPSPVADGSLALACRLLGFVPRNDLTTLWVRARDPQLARADSVVPSPLFYLGF
jgi:GNAT superfamily N-acetyltransferase